MNADNYRSTPAVPPQPFAMIAWFRRIDSSAEVAQVLEVVREYVATCAPEDLAQLPTACKPRRLGSAGELEALHDCLREEYRLDRLTGDARTMLHRLTSLVVRASMRLADLQGETRDDDPPPSSGKRDAAARRD